MPQTNCCCLLPVKKYEIIPYCLNPFAAREFVLLMQSLQRSLIETSPNIHFVKLWFSCACTRSPSCCLMTSYRQIQNASSSMSYDVIKAAKGLNVILSSVDFSPGCAPLIRPAGYVICTLCCAYCLPLFLAKFTSLNCITGLFR